MKVERVDLYCPACGHRGVYVDRDDSGSVENGTDHWCLACHARLPDLSEYVDTKTEQEEWYLNRYLTIREASNVNSDAAETLRLRDVHAALVAEREARWKAPGGHPHRPFGGKN